MQNTTIQKINTLGKVGYIISKIGGIVLQISMIACVICGILMCFVPKNSIRVMFSASNAVSVDMYESYDSSRIFHFDPNAGKLIIGNRMFDIIKNNSDSAVQSSRVYYLSDVKWLLFGTAITCAVTYIALRFSAKLCKLFKNCETPFTDEISKGLICLAWSLIPVSVISSIMESVTDSIASETLNLGITVDLTTVLLILCIFMLSYIFKHGTALQTEADETL